MDSDFIKLARRQLSPGLSMYRQAAATAPEPKSGWLATMRKAIGMTTTQLARRIGVAHPGVVRLEKNEKDGKVTIASMRKAAEAMNCEFVYAIIPRHHKGYAGALPTTDEGNVLDDFIRQEAYRAAYAEARRVGRTMALEDQALADDAFRAQVQDRAAELAANPRRLWDLVESLMTRQPPRTKGKSRRV